MRFLLLGLLVFHTVCLPAQVLPVEDEPAFTNKNVFSRIKRDGYYAGKTILETYKRPLHWEKKEWIKFGVVLGATAATMILDEPIYDFVQDKNHPLINTLSDAGSAIGDPSNNFPVILTLWGSGVAFNNDWLRDTGVMLFTSVATAGVIQTFTKEIGGRARPGTGEGPYKWDFFNGSPGYHSFPSGHMTMVVSTSWIMAHQVNWLPAKMVFYAVPVAVGASRIFDNAHWFSDVVFGSLLSIACAESVIKLYPKLKSSDGLSGLRIIPMPQGLSLRYTF